MIQTIASKYTIIKKIGCGTFSDVYKALEIDTNKEVAVKLEFTRSKHPQLLYEAKLYRILQGGVGIPNVHWYGVEGDYNVMVIDLLGPSLEDLFNYCKHKFSIKTVLMLADQMIQRIEYVHSRHFLHRDIKPDNFLIGNEDQRNIYLIDFGFAKKYIQKGTGEHIPFKEGKKISGFVKYASNNNLLGFELSRRDDYESLGYLLIYRSLPWIGLKSKSAKDKLKNITTKKLETNIEDLCKGLHFEFIQYFEYVRNLKFEDTPDTDFLRKVFQNLLVDLDYDNDFEFDWIQSSKIQPVLNEEEKEEVEESKTPRAE